jgi:hypothetical protein
MDRIPLVLFDMNNKIFGPYLAAVHRIPVCMEKRHSALDD